MISPINTNQSQPLNIPSHTYGIEECVDFSEKHQHLTKFTNNKFVYVVAYSDGVVKVGMTTNFKQRLPSLRNGRDIANCFLILSGEGEKVERKSHRALGDHRLNGEYFSCDFLMAVDCVIQNKAKPLILSDSEIEEIKLKESAKITKIMDCLSGLKEIDIEDHEVNAHKQKTDDNSDSLKDDDMSISMRYESLANHQTDSSERDRLLNLAAAYKDRDAANKNINKIRSRLNALNIAQSH